MEKLTCDICKAKTHRRPKHSKSYFQCFGTQKDVTINVLEKTRSTHCPRNKHNAYQTMTEKEFMDKGVELFGEDVLKWKFRCPVCGNIQTPEDFRQYKEQGANPDSAHFNCIGRYQDDPYRAFGENKIGHPVSPCDYTVGGLFKFGNIIKMKDGKEIVAFPFAKEKSL